MKFSIIGTGNMAWFLGKRITAAGHKCMGVYGRNKEAADELADNLLAANAGTINDLRDGEADVCFLAVSDNGIEDAAWHLSFKETVLVHCAGARDIDLIARAAKDSGVLWPVYSILRQNLPAHRDIPCAWEASSDRAKRFILEMGHAITDNLFEAKGQQRKWLHLAAVMSNNFINHLLAIDEKICEENGVPNSVLQPLIMQTFERLKNGSPMTLQTGPAIRHDDGTLKAHKELLSAHPEFRRVYEAMTLSIQEMYK